MKFFWKKKGVPTNPAEPFKGDVKEALSHEGIEYFIKAVDVQRDSMSPLMIEAGRNNPRVIDLCNAYINEYSRIRREIMRATLRGGGG